MQLLSPRVIITNLFHSIIHSLWLGPYYLYSFNTHLPLPTLPSIIQPQNMIFHFSEGTCNYLISSLAYLSPSHHLMSHWNTTTLVKFSEVSSSSRDFLSFMLALNFAHIVLCHIQCINIICYQPANILWVGTSWWLSHSLRIGPRNVHWMNQYMNVKEDLKVN